MKNIILSLFLILTLNAKGQLIEGYNLGQLFHFAQMEWRNEGFVPANEVENLKAKTPEHYRSYARMSGTMSNQWALDLPGFQHLAHDAQINRNRNIPQPTISYGYAFMQFFKDFGFDSLIWTLNTISPYVAGESPTGDGIWMKRLWAFLDAIDSAGIPISHICLDNESWMYGQVVGISVGSPNAGDKIRYAGIGGIFLPNARFEPQIRAEMHRYLNWQSQLVPLLRKRYPNTTILMTVDHPTQHMRGRLMWDVVRSYNFYDGITPHLYPDVRNVTQLRQWIDARLKPFGHVPIYITEWNYHYDSGNPWATFHDDFINHVKTYSNVKMVMRHTLWAADNNPFSAVRLR